MATETEYYIDRHIVNFSLSWGA